jgi:hypothetical protein
MNKLLPLVFVFLISCATANAMPVAPFSQVQTGLTITVGSGYGFWVCRGLFNYCTPVYVFGGNYGGKYRGYSRAHYDGPYVRYHDNGGVVVVDKQPCDFGSYLSCSHGTCWQFCY